MRNKVILGIICSFFFILSVNAGILYSYGDSIYVQDHNNTIQLDDTFEFIRYSNDIGTKENISNIEISFPSSEWNITDVNLNFTNIKMGKEVFSVEEGGESFKKLNKGQSGLGVQLNITEKTLIYGFEIYGYLAGTSFSDVFVEMRGYQNPGMPNETIYGDQVLINMTNIPRWYEQILPAPVSVDPGYYFLVLNGSDYNNNPSDNSDYHWYLNESGSVNINLDTAKYDTDWNNLDTGKPFRHKIIQRVNRSYNPEDLNMTAEINGTYYTISNGTSLYSGNLTVNDLDFILNGTDLNIPISTNQSFEIMYNLSYDIAASDSFKSSGSTIIEEDQDNIWKIFPEITRVLPNHTINIKIPSSWTNLQIKKNGLALSSPIDFLIIGDNLYIWNSSISSGADWVISAKSPQVSFTLNFPETTFEPNQNLRFSATPPSIEGNITFILIDSLGFEEHIEEKVVNNNEIVFSYAIPTNPHEGTYRIYIYWYTNLQAGVQTNEIQITIPFTINMELLFFTLFLILVAAAISASTYLTYKRMKNKVALKREKLVNKCIDVLNLNYVLVIEKESGLSVYEQFLGGKTMDTTLVSGFLEAIRNFGIELTGAYNQSQTMKLEYKESKILMAEFKNFRLIIIMKDSPSEDFLEAITTLSYDIEESFGKSLKEFDGFLEPFKGIKVLIEKHLNTMFLSPLRVVENPDTNLTSSEKNELNKAMSFMKKNKMDFFFTSFLLPEQSCEPSTVEAIFSLIDKRIFQPFEPSKMGKKIEK